MRAFSLLALLATASPACAQAGSPPNGPGGSFAGAPPSNRNASRGGSQTQSIMSETVRLLTLRSVQTDLGLTLAQYDPLIAIVRSLGNASSEETAYAAVSRALTASQAKRLQELLIQDLGYNALTLGSVRTALTLTNEQTTQISAVLSTMETAKRAAATAADPRVAQQAIASLMSQTSAALAKLLTEEQDAKLHSLAGKALGSR